MQQGIDRSPWGGGGRVSGQMEPLKPRHRGTKAHGVWWAWGSALRQWRLALWEGGESKGNGGSGMS